MATRLVNLRVSRIDLVTEGASQDPTGETGAHVLLFKRAPGPRGADGATAYEAICKLAEAMVVKSAVPLTIEQARVRVMEQRPDLYERHARERA